MTAKEFIKGYQVPSGKDWLITHEEVVIKLIEAFASQQCKEQREANIIQIKKLLYLAPVTEIGNAWNRCIDKVIKKLK